MNLIPKTLLAAGLCVSAAGVANAVGWPANYEGVMLQGFYWDSYQETKWQNLTAQSDELSQSFKLIWIPQSANCRHQSMGYDPVYWFSNYNCSFGSETHLRNMINTFKEKGTGIIADVVVNHRCGVNNWTDFPTETWNGKTYKLGPEHICCTDEVRNQPGQATPTGAPDTGDDFGSARDLDHTSPTVQDNVKDYTKFLLTELGYTGFRYDMVKGFGGQYVGIYNRFSKPTFSVGEFWDGYDAIVNWINATGKESAAFDFPFKYAVKEAFANNDFSKLVWKANGTTDQPAGLIHAGYAQYAVTFIDNHDTSRDGNAFQGNVVAANAFMLCSPGTPCVFYKHWTAYKDALKPLIAVRNAVGVSNTSAVRVLRADRNCYMAEVTGSKGKLVVKIGSAQVSPDGYTNADIKASGTDYCVWAKTGGTTPVTPTDPDPVTPPSTDAFTVYFDNGASNWTTPHIHYWGGTSVSSWPGVAMTKAEGNVWKYQVAAGTTGLLFNAGDGDASKTADFVAKPNHVYSTAGDQGEYSGAGGGGTDPVTPPNPSVDMPSQLYILGNLKVGSWTTDAGVTMAKSDNCFVAGGVEFVPAAPTETSAYFTLVTILGDDWNIVNSADRYGAAETDAVVSIGTSAKMMKYPVNVSASAAKSWKVPVGKYDVMADFANMTVTVTTETGVEVITADQAADGSANFYNLQGQQVKRPTNGLYIRVLNGHAAKVLVK